MTVPPSATRTRLRPQVAATDHYQWRYHTLVRTITHWHQANEVIRHSGPGARILELGPGSGHVTWLLRQHSRDVLTVDLDPEVAPNIVASAHALPLPDAFVHTVLAAEILEHMPFPMACTALREFARVAARYVVISLPAPIIGAAFLVNVTRIAPRGGVMGLPYAVPHKFDGEHYWELGKRGYPKRRIRAALHAAGLRIVREFRPFPSLYCYFFTCEKRSAPSVAAADDTT